MKKSPPCPECPYKLGLVETVANPCPQCMLDDYKTFETFKNQTGHYNPKQHEDEQNNTSS